MCTNSWVLTKSRLQATIRANKSPIVRHWQRQSAGITALVRQSNSGFYQYSSACSSPAPYKDLFPTLQANKQPKATLLQPHFYKPQKASLWHGSPLLRYIEEDRAVNLRGSIEKGHFPSDSCLNSAWLKGLFKRTYTMMKKGNWWFDLASFPPCTWTPIISQY